MFAAAVEPLRQATFDWLEDNVPQMGAALAFYSVLSVAPLLLIVIALAGTVFGEAVVRNEVVGQIRGMVGAEGAKAIQDMLAHSRQSGDGVLATMLGVATLVIGATGVFGQLQTSLNTIWDVRPKPGLNIWTYIRARFLSFAMVLGTGFLLLVSLVLSAAVAALGRYLGNFLPSWTAVANTTNLILSFGLVTALFALIFKVLPDVQIGWRDVWLGAVLTSLLFTIGKGLIGLYLAHTDVGTAYGGAGSLVVLVLWIYYSSQILFFGAELTKGYSTSHGSRAPPVTFAEKVPDQSTV